MTPAAPPALAAPHGPDEAAILARLRPPAPLAQPAVGWLAQAEARLVGQTNPSEAAGGGLAGGIRQDARLAGWWQPGWGPRWWALLDSRARGFAPGYRPDATASLALVGVQPVWGPLALHGGASAIGLLGGPAAPTGARVLLDLLGGLSATWQATPGLALIAGYQLDRVNPADAPVFVLHGGRAAFAWRWAAGWAASAELLAQWRLFTDDTYPRHRVTLGLDRAVGGGWQAGLLAQGVANGDRSGWVTDLAVGPRLRWGY